MNFITYVSDLDYSYNPQTKEFDLPAVEWEDCYGRHWETFSSEEERTKALDENERINNQPHIKAQIEAERIESDISYFMYEVNDLLDWRMKNSQKVELSDAMGTINPSQRHHLDAYLLENKPHVHKAIKEAVLKHNKSLMKVSYVKPTTYTLGELF